VVATSDDDGVGALDGVMQARVYLLAQEWLGNASGTGKEAKWVVVTAE